MDHAYESQYGRVLISPLSQADAERMRILRNQNSSRFLDSRTISKEQQKIWYEAYLKNQQDYMFSVYLMQPKQWIGAVSIYNVDTLSRTAEFGRLILDKSNIAQRGLGVDATMAACQFAFDRLQIQNLYLRVQKDNIAAIRTYEKAGFYIVEELSDVLHMENNNTVRMKNES